jgi:glycerol-3-phosphate dehydrogenase
MGEETIDRAVELANLPPHASMTANLPLHGCTQTPAPEPLMVYGTDADMIQTLPGATLPLHPRLPYSEAEVRWASRYELAHTVEDVLARRTRALFLDAIASIEAAPRVAAILAEELEKDDRWQQQQVYTYQTLAMGYLINERKNLNH